MVREVSEKSICISRILLFWITFILTRPFGSAASPGQRGVPVLTFRPGVRLVLKVATIAAAPPILQLVRIVILVIIRRFAISSDTPEKTTRGRVLRI